MNILYLVAKLTIHFNIVPSTFLHMTSYADKSMLQH